MNQAKWWRVQVDSGVHVTSICGGGVAYKREREMENTLLWPMYPLCPQYPLSSLPLQQKPNFWGGNPVLCPAEEQ